MKKKKTMKKIFTVLSLTLLLAIPVTGCLDDEPEFREGYWWDHPGEGGCHYDDGCYDWWNALDESWTIDDWEYTEDDIWMIYDAETDSYYFYDEENDEYAASDADMEEFYFLDRETGEWIPEE